ncbi:glycoside hydrolase family 16 protein [Xylariaceae sp. FL0016]|nr:glycoside hydrolase family 16 protein [Xylariaceae sp. FL0016]
MRRCLLSPWPLLFARSTLAACECGYSVHTGTERTRYVFTDLFESDLVHVNVLGGEQGWAAQEDNRTAEAARGPYGELFTVDDVFANTIADRAVFDGDGVRGPGAGLQLMVKGNSEIAGGMVSNAEIATTGLDYFYGTYRAGIKVTDVEGTCSAFFWYQNDTQEIDVEFLSAEFNRTNGTFPVNLVLQSAASSAAGYDASGTPSFRRVNLPFDPTTAFHEYRFDFVRDRVVFYADGAVLAEMVGTGVPSSPGHLLLSHWSNGNPGWSRGPPKEDAVTTVSYVKAYYNSSLASRMGDHARRCGNPAAEDAVCAVPENNATFFFTDGNNSNPNQTTDTDGGDKSGAGNLRVCLPFILTTVSAAGAWTCGSSS